MIIVATRVLVVCFFKQKTAYEMRISDWSSDVCSSDLFGRLDGDIFYAMGFSGQGVALTTLAGKVIAEAVAGQAERFDVLAQVPTPRFPGGTLLRWPSLVVGMLYHAMLDKL